MQQREAAADDRVTDLAHRHRPRHRARPAQPQQLVLAGELVDRGAAVHPRHVMPQRQRLRVAQHRTDPPSNDHPLTHRCAVALHRLGGEAGRDDHRPLGQQVPRALARLRVCRVLVVDRQLVADPPVGEKLAAVVGQGRHRAAAGRVDPQPVALVGDLRKITAVQGFPARRRRSRDQAVGAPAQRRDVAGQPADRPPAVLDQCGQLVAVGVEHPHTVSERLGQPRRHHVGSLVRQRIPHHQRSLDGAGDQGERIVARRTAQLPRVAPAGQQVEVHLVGLRAGDGVVVRAVGQLHPRLLHRGLRIAGAAEQPGEHGEALAVQHRVLGVPVGLLGVDVGDVLAGVDRVHVAGLRRRCGPPLVQFGAHRCEELPRQAAHEPRPGVSLIPVTVNLGDPLVRRRVVGADRQQHVARQRHLLQLREQFVGGGFGLFEGRRRVHPPARRIVRRHVVGEQAAARRGDPLELAGELHALGIALVLHRAPLVVRPARPRAGRQPRVCRHAGKLRVVAEHVELPRGGRLGTHHVALKAHAVHEVSDRRLGAGQVGVRLVVGAAHDFDAPVADEPAQVGAVLGMGVPVRLEVVDLGEHELVIRVPCAPSRGVQPPG